MNGQRMAARVLDALTKDEEERDDHGRWTNGGASSPSIQSVSGHNLSLRIGEDYGHIFGLSTAKKQSMIYNGGHSWTAKNGENVRTMENAPTTQKVLTAIKSSFDAGKSASLLKIDASK